MMVEKVSVIKALIDDPRCDYVTFYLNEEHECMWRERHELECDTLSNREVSIARLFLETRGFNNSPEFIKQLHLSRETEFNF